MATWAWCSPNTMLGAIIPCAFLPCMPHHSAALQSISDEVVLIEVPDNRMLFSHIFRFADLLLKHRILQPSPSANSLDMQQGFSMRTAALLPLVLPQQRTALWDNWTGNTLMDIACMRGELMGTDDESTPYPAALPHSSPQLWGQPMQPLVCYKFDSNHLELVRGTQVLLPTSHLKYVVVYLLHAHSGIVLYSRHIHPLSPVKQLYGWLLGQFAHPSFFWHFILVHDGSSMQLQDVPGRVGAMGMALRIRCIPIPLLRPWVPSSPNEEPTRATIIQHYRAVLTNHPTVIGGHCIPHSGVYWLHKLPKYHYSVLSSSPVMRRWHFVQWSYAEALCSYLAVVPHPDVVPFEGTLRGYFCKRLVLPCGYSIGLD